MDSAGGGGGLKYPHGSATACGAVSIHVSYPGLPRSGKTFWKMKKIPGQGKVREFHFQSGKSRKNEKKSHGKVRENQSFPHKVAS